MKILVTGFDPFGGESINPAYEAVKLLPSTIAGAEIIKLEIPTVFTRSVKVVEEAIEKYNPDIILNVGQAGGRTCMSVEKVAINLAEARIPDNDGEQPFDQKLREDGETAYFSTLPVKAMVENMKAHRILANISYTAGTYVCNSIMYHVLYLLQNKFPGKRGGFIHVPYENSQVLNKNVGMPFMPLTMIAEGLKYAIEAAVENETDIQTIMGETH